MVDLGLMLAPGLPTRRDRTRGQAVAGMLEVRGSVAAVLVTV